MNIFLVEDSVSIRRLLVRRLDSMPGMRIVGEASGETQALALIRWTQPDVVLMDLSLAQGSGLHLLGELRRAGYKGRVAVLTSQESDAFRGPCIAAGADAFYDKASGLETLFDDLNDMAAPQDDTLEDRPAELLRSGLNGLYNEAMCDRLGQTTRAAGRDGLNLAVYVLRLDGLDAMAADTADLVAESVGTRLRESCVDAEIVPLRSADQFSVVLTRVDEANHAAAYAQRLSALMHQPFNQGERNYRLDVGLGMALFPTDAVSPRGLLTLAEATAFGAL